MAGGLLRASAKRCCVMSPTPRSHFVIDPSRGIISGEIEGVLSKFNLLFLRAAIRSSPLFHESYHHLLDLRRVHMVQLTGMEASDIASYGLAGAGSRWAFVLPEKNYELIYGLVRMIAGFSGAGGERILSFRTVEEAQAWLRGNADPASRNPPSGAARAEPRAHGAELAGRH